jgi:colanic acid/amylovoran biosynthesis glycosyltransferase
MKIAFLVDVFPALSQTFILNQITGLIDQGHTVHIFASGREKNRPVHPAVVHYNLLQRTHYWNSPPPGIARLSTFLKTVLLRPGKLALVARSVNPFRFGKKALFLNIFYDLLPFIQATEDFDVIHCQFGNIGEKGVFLKQVGATNAPLITSFRGHDLTHQVQANGRDMYRGLFRRGDLFVPICNYFKDLLVDIGCPAQKITVLRDGIDVGRFSFAFRNLPFTGRTVRIATVGRLEEKKGVGYALQALAQLKKNCPGISFRYEVMGDGPLMDSLRQEARQLGLEAAVVFHGAKAQAEVIGLLAAADIFLAPHVTAACGDKEGIPNVLKEAMAMGVPVISTYHSGIPELVEHERTGFLVAEKDVAALAAQLERVITKESSLKEITLAARKTVEQQYDIQLLNDDLEKIYAGSL